MATITAQTKHTNRRPLEVDPAFAAIEPIYGARLRLPIPD
jgi:hypothetical protein